MQNIPLAENLRPRNLNEFIGQNKLLGTNSPLRQMIENDRFNSFILWGPPGCGKTTIARLIEINTSSIFYKFSAVVHSIKEIKQIMEKSIVIFQDKQTPTILFIDEIHRFNKSQQDVFLPYIESGVIILIGATTENPSFEVISALISRCHIFVLEKLTDIDLMQILNRAIEQQAPQLKFEESAMGYLINHAMGDARKALNNLEIIIRYYANNQSHPCIINLEMLADSLGKKSLYYDKNADEHFNLISALHKALRGSDAQAGLYWMARMLEGGEDPLYIVRRLVRFAVEDIGLAAPEALQQAIAVKEAVHFLGMPEAGIHIAQLVVYLATAPKSNAIYAAYQEVKKDAQKTGDLSVPLHIRNAPTKLMKNLGYAEGYQYAHDFQNAYVKQKYFPDSMENKIYYKPGKFGFEKEIKKRLDWWKKQN